MRSVFRRLLAPTLAVAFIAGCAGGSSSVTTIDAFPAAPLSTTDVQTLIAQAVTQAAHDGVDEVVAVSDREGNVLGVFQMTGAPSVSPDGDEINAPAGNTTVLIAVEKARTAAFLSNNQSALSTRTAAFIVQPHFPPTVKDTPDGPLFGLPFSSLPCGDVQKNGNGLTGALGGIPIYKSGVFAGGIGVDGTGTDEDEVVALAGVQGIYGTPPSIAGDNIYLDGIQFPYVGATQPTPGLTAIPFASLPGTVDPGFPIRATPPPAFPPATIDGVPGDEPFPIIDSPMATTPKLTAADVTTIFEQAVNQELTTRAALRLPIGVPTRMVVGVTDLDGNILGVFRTNDATTFSFDIVIQKARTVVTFTNPATTFGQSLRTDLGLPTGAALAVTSRTLGFLAQPFYPPGIDGTTPGPLYQIQQNTYMMPPAPNCAPQGNGITVFPGSVPLYKDGVLVGGLGVSGDGVDQDDFITFAGAQGYMPAGSIQANNITFRGTPLPFLKFPRHPGL